MYMLQSEYEQQMSLPLLQYVRAIATVNDPISNIPDGVSLASICAGSSDNSSLLSPVLNCNSRSSTPVVLSAASNAIALQHCSTGIPATMHLKWCLLAIC